MKITIVSVLLVALAGFGCKKKDEGGEGGEATSGDKAEGADKGAAKSDIEPFGGKLTVEVITKAARQVKVYNDDTSPRSFDDALKDANTALGKPTLVDGPKHYWAVMQDDGKCSMFRLDNKDGNADSRAMTNIDPIAKNQHEECSKAAGAAAGGDEAGKDGEGDKKEGADEGGDKKADEGGDKKADEGADKK